MFNSTYKVVETMSAKDDFSNIKAAVAIADGVIDTVSYTASFESLFTPRPLRELVTKETQRAWVKLPHAGWIGHHFDDKVIACLHWSEVDIKPFLDYPAIPILSPEQMGQP